MEIPTFLTPEVTVSTGAGAGVETLVLAAGGGSETGGAGGLPQAANPTDIITVMISANTFA